MNNTFKTFTKPINNNPIVVFMFQEMYRQRVTQADMSKRSGVCKDTFKDWRTRTMPRLPEIQACLNVLGYGLAVYNRNGGSGASKKISEFSVLDQE